MIKKIIFSATFILISLRGSDSVEEIFTHIYQTNTWASSETVSGPGSELKKVQRILPGISMLIKVLNIKSIADAPCGDFHWMQFIDLGMRRYIGIDIVKELIERNSKLYGNALCTFKHLNLITDPIDTVDLIICRDMLGHLTHAQIFEVLKNFKKSGSKYLLVTTIKQEVENIDIAMPGVWDIVNLEKPPFNFPKPLFLIEEEGSFEFEEGKHLGLWRLDDIKID